MVNDDEPCELCMKHKAIGEKLPKVKYLLFTRDKAVPSTGLSVRFGTFGRVYFMEDPGLKDDLLGSDSVMEKNIKGWSI